MTTIATDAEPGARPARTPSAAPPRWLAICAVLAAAIIYSSSFAVTKVTLADVPPLTIGAMRLTVAAVILGTIVHLRREQSIPTKREKVGIGVAGLLGITAYFALENVGVDLASASDATLIVASYPLITLALELLLGKASLSLVRPSGMPLTIVGVCMVVVNGRGASSDNEHHVIGDLLLLAGGIAWATFNIAAQRESSGSSAVVTTFYQTVAGAAGFVLLSLFVTEHWSTPPAGALLRIAFLAVLCSVAAFLAYDYGLKAPSPSMTVNLLNVVSVAGLAWAVLLAGETLAPMQVIGGSVVILGATLGQTRTRSEPAAAPDMEHGLIEGPR